MKKTISEFTQQSLEHDTTAVLYWIKRAEQYLQEGNARMAFLSLNNCNTWFPGLMDNQVRINERDLQEPDWKLIYNICDERSTEDINKNERD